MFRLHTNKSKASSALRAVTDYSRLQYPLESHVSLEEWNFFQMQLRPLKQNGALQPKRKQPALQSKGNGKEEPRSLSKGRGYQIQREQILSSVAQGCCTAREDRTCSADLSCSARHSRAAQQGVSRCGSFHHPLLRMERQPAAQTLWDRTFAPLIIRIFSGCWWSKKYSHCNVSY